MEQKIEIPKCPNCKKPLDDVYEYGDFSKDWIWNEETQLYEDLEEKWDNVTAHCRYCGHEIDNTFLLDHLEHKEK
jgi:hypothetical protein